MNENINILTVDSCHHSTSYRGGGRMFDKGLLKLYI